MSIFMNVADRDQIIMSLTKMLRRNSENKKITFLMQQTIHPGLKKV